MTCWMTAETPHLQSLNTPPAAIKTLATGSRFSDSLMSPHLENWWFCSKQATGIHYNIYAFLGLFIQPTVRMDSAVVKSPKASLSWTGRVLVCFHFPKPRKKDKSLFTCLPEELWRWLWPRPSWWLPLWGWCSTDQWSSEDSSKSHLEPTVGGSPVYTRRSIHHRGHRNIYRNHWFLHRRVWAKTIPSGH